MEEEKKVGKTKKAKRPSKDEKVVYFGSIRSLVNTAQRRAFQPGVTYVFKK